jgi:hypothetical protein
MKLRHIFALVPDCHVRGRYAEVWQRHFYDGLVQAGLKVVVPRNVDFSWARPLRTFNLARSAETRARASEALFTQILTADGGPPQAVFSYCFSHDLELDLVDRVRAAGIPWINFFCDSLHGFDWVSALAARTSLNWFVESAAEERYRMLGVPFLRAPYALNPDALPDASCATIRQALLFIGAANRDRIRAAALIRLTGADLQVRGLGWKESLGPNSDCTAIPSNLFKEAARTALRALFGARVGEHLDYPAMIDELRRSAVVLRLNEDGTGPEAPSYLKLRDLEFPGMGCCYLTHLHADLAEIFDVGREVIAFRTPWEASRLSKDLARHPAECREIGRRARRRVLAEHTWTARLPLIAARL